MSFDLGKTKVTAPCSNCGAENDITLNQVANEETIKCKCGAELKLIDEGGKAKASIKEFNDSLNKFGKS